MATRQWGGFAPDYQGRRNAQMRQALLQMLSQGQRKKEFDASLLLQEEQLDRLKTYQDASLQIRRDELEALKTHRNNTLRGTRTKDDMQKIKNLRGLSSNVQQLLLDQGKESGESASFIKTREAILKNTKKKEEVETVEQQLASQKKVEDEKRAVQTQARSQRHLELAEAQDTRAIQRNLSQRQQAQINSLERRRQFDKTKAIEEAKVQEAKQEKREEKRVKLSDKEIAETRKRLGELQKDLISKRKDLSRLIETPQSTLGFTTESIFEEQIAPPKFVGGKEVTGGHFKSITKEQFGKKQDDLFRIIRGLESKIAEAKADISRRSKAVTTKAPPAATTQTVPAKPKRPKPNNTKELQVQLKEIEATEGEAAAAEYFERFKFLYERELPWLPIDRGAR